MDGFPVPAARGGDRGFGEMDGGMMGKILAVFLLIFVIPIALAAGCLVVYLFARWLHGRFGWFDDLFL